MKTIKTLLVPLILAVSIGLVASAAMAGGEIKLALDCPPDPDQCGTYFWSTTFSDFLESKGQKVKLYQRDALGGEVEKEDRGGMLPCLGADFLLESRALEAGGEEVVEGVIPDLALGVETEAEILGE